MHEPKIIIITGASSGLGKELALQHKNDNCKIIGISRNIEALSNLKNAIGKNFSFSGIDLSQPLDSVVLENEILSHIKDDKVDEIILFNNASTIDPIDRVNKLDDQSIYKLFNLNIISAFILSKIILNISNKFSCKTSIINISSGVSKKPIEGWSLYCSSKAAVNMLTENLNIENNNKDFYTISINPGALDTSMQKQIRKADSKTSPISEFFREMKANNKLKDPKAVAKEIKDISISKTHQSGLFIDFNNL